MKPQGKRSWGDALFLAGLVVVVLYFLGRVNGA